MTVQPAHRQVPVVEIHSHHWARGVDIVSSRCVAAAHPRWHRGDRPRRDEISPGTPWFVGNGVGHRISAADPLHPLVPAMCEHRWTRQHVAATGGIGQVFQRFRQAQTHLARRGDGDREVAERFVGGTVRGDAVARRPPLLTPLIGGQTSGVEVVAGVGEPFPALDHMDPVCGSISLHAGELTTQLL